MGISVGLQRLLIKTRNSRREYWREPWNPRAIGIDRSAAELCISRSVRLVGTDYLSIERLGDGAVHKCLLENEVVILEGLYLADVSAGWYDLIAAPVKLEGTDGGWCRALLRFRTPSSINRRELPMSE